MRHIYLVAFEQMHDLLSLITIQSQSYTIIANADKHTQVNCTVRQCATKTRRYNYRRTP